MGNRRIYARQLWKKSCEMGYAGNIIRDIVFIQKSFEQADWWKGSPIVYRPSMTVSNIDTRTGECVSERFLSEVEVDEKRVFGRRIYAETGGRYLEDLIKYVAKTVNELRLK